MYCPKCGTENTDNSIQCVNCGEPIEVSKVNLNKESDNINYQQTIEQVENIDTPLIWSILVTIFGAMACCCLNPISLATGITALVFASQAKSKMRSGNREEALRCAKIARILNWVSFGFLVLTLLVIGFLVDIGIIFRS